jgi:hypothetical protein
VLPAEHLLDLTGFDLDVERVERLLEVGHHVLAGLRPLDQDREVVDAPGQRIAEIDVFADPLAPPQRGLGVGLVVPEVGRGNPRLEPAQFLVESSGVKDSSADRRPA